MNQEPEQDPNWQRIKKVFFTAPTVNPSEHFVFSVMDRIKPREATSFSWFARWFVPAFLGSVFLISILYSPSEKPIFETVLKGGGPLVSEEVSAFQAEASQDWTGLEAL